MTKRGRLRYLNSGGKFSGEDGTTTPASNITTPSNIPDSVIPAATITDDQVIKAFSDLTGYNPTTGANNKGVVVLDALNYWRKNGVAGHKIDAFTAIDWKNKTNVEAAIYLFGNVCLGLQLPITAKTQDIWDVPAGGAVGNGLPNSWGGHFVCGVGFDINYIYIVTWGVLKKMTWAFLNTYCDEAYVVISSEFAGTKAVNGFDITQLQNDLQDINNLSVLYDPVNTTSGNQNNNSNSNTSPTGG